MINPLSVATKGLLGSPLSMASKGKLGLVVVSVTITGQIYQEMPAFRFIPERLVYSVQGGIQSSAVKENLVTIIDLKGRDIEPALRIREVDFTDVSPLTATSLLERDAISQPAHRVIEKEDVFVSISSEQADRLILSDKLTNNDEGTV